MDTLRWQPITTMVLSIAGLGVSIYLTLTHFSTAVTLSCPAGGGAINCEKVTTSPQSYVFGIPVAVLGLAYFLPMLVLCLPVAWRSFNRWIHLARLLLSVAGVGMVIYLVSAELFTIKAICLWCTSVHVITFLIFVLVVTTTPMVLGWGQRTESADYAEGVGSE
ncbi:MAG TPA: vitamin K epoxide reductase family protein [Acidimicrobiales bacterium]|nr:vitamin K epoxide reductase family protein [Acidimicrobiales bacterium]